MLHKGKTLDPTIAAFIESFLSITVSELGDKTQIMTSAPATRFGQPIAVFSGALLAFAAIDGVSILLAGSLRKRLAMGKVGQISAIVFMAIGILRLLETVWAHS